MGKEYRINGFKQIECFYSLVFSGKYDFSPQHISLYMFLLNQNNRINWVEWFKCPYDLAMNGAMIGSKKTYYNCLNDLKSWGLIKYEAGENQFKAPKISLLRLDNEPQLIPQCEPAHTPLLIPAPAPLPTSARVRYINYISNNLNNLVTNNIKQLEHCDFDFDKTFLITVAQSNEERGGAFSNHNTTGGILGEMQKLFSDKRNGYKFTPEDLSSIREIGCWLGENKDIMQCDHTKVLSDWSRMLNNIEENNHWKTYTMQQIFKFRAAIFDFKPKVLQMNAIIPKNKFAGRGGIQKYE